MALDEKWLALAPKVGSANEVTVVLSCRLNSAGGLVDVRIVKSSNDPLSDKAALSVASRVSSIRGLPPKFVAKFMKESFVINYRVKGR